MDHGDFDEILTDENDRDYIIKRGTRYHYKDYMLTLNDTDVNLLRFVVLSDITAKKDCFTAPRDYLNIKEGVVFWPCGVKPILQKKDVDAFYDSLVEEEVPRSTLTRPFKGKNYKLTWKAIAIKAVFKDFGK